MSNHSISRVIIPCHPPTGKSPTGQTFKDLTGLRVGRLVVQKFIGKRVMGDGRWRYCWNCQCDCGNTVSIISGSLKSGATKSCGCLRKQAIGIRSSTHRMTKSPEFSAWSAMWNRCTKPNTSNYKNYGGRGITVCERWRKFEHFFEDMGARPATANSIERCDNNGDYEPNNCRWATWKEQGRNRRTNHLVVFENKTLCIKEWSDLVGISPRAIYGRLKVGWSIEDALTKPARKWPSQLSHNNTNPSPPSIDP